MYQIGEYLIEKITNSSSYKIHFQDKFSGQLLHIVVDNLQTFFDTLIQEKYYKDIYYFKKIFEQAFGDDMQKFLNRDDAQTLINAIPQKYNDVIPGFLPNAQAKRKWHCEAFIEAYNKIYGTNLQLDQVLPYIQHVEF